MYKTSTELIKGELPKDIVKPLYRIFEDANIAYNELVSNTPFFKGDFFNNIKGRLLSFLVMKQFDVQYLPTNFPFESLCIKMAFGQERVELRRENIVLNIARAVERNQLPFKSQYKEEYSKGNSSIETQLRMKFLEGGLEIHQQPFYGMIIYKASHDEIEFVDLVIPDSKFETILDTVPLKPRFTVHTMEDISDDQERIISIANLKKEVLKVEDEMKSEGN